MNRGDSHAGGNEILATRPQTLMRVRTDAVPSWQPRNRSTSCDVSVMPCSALDSRSSRHRPRHQPAAGIGVPPAGSGTPGGREAADERTFARGAAAPVSSSEFTRTTVHAARLQANDARQRRLGPRRKRKSRVRENPFLAPVGNRRFTACRARVPHRTETTMRPRGQNRRSRLR